MNRPAIEPDFFLVHGAFGDGSAWQLVLPLLSAGGAKATVIDLPGHTAADNARAGEFTLEDYVEAVREGLMASPKPVVLVGHSVAGMVITGVAEAVPEKVAALVYVAGFLPESGRSAMSYAETDTASRFGANFVPDESAGVGTITQDGLIDAVFNETAPELARSATQTIRPEPLQPFTGTIETTPERFGSVPRYYVMTEHDHAVTPTLQQEMLDALPAARVFTLHADHAPFLSAPEELAQALLDVRRHAAESQ